jgi:hypothetical protein
MLPSFISERMISVFFAVLNEIYPGCLTLRALQKGHFELSRYLRSMGIAFVRVGDIA